MFLATLPTERPKANKGTEREKRRASSHLRFVVVRFGKWEGGDVLLRHIGPFFFLLLPSSSSSSSTYIVSMKGDTKKK